MTTDFDFTSYIHLVPFLGSILGEQSEVILYSFEDLDHSIIALHNGHVSGKELGDPVTSFALSKLKDKGKAGPPYYLNYLSLSKTNIQLRSNSLFILDRQGNPKGMLSINTDVSKYQQAAELLQQLAFLPTHIEEKSNLDDAARLITSPKEMILSIVDEVTLTLGVSADRLTATEKVEIVRRLNEEGFFLMKGAVALTASVLGSSEATIYRYLSTVNKEKSDK